MSIYNKKIAYALIDKIYIKYIDDNLPFIIYIITNIKLFYTLCVLTLFCIHIFFI